jgi:hypothetical protein
VLSSNALFALCLQLVDFGRPTDHTTSGPEHEAHDNIPRHLGKQTVHALFKSR